MHVLVMGVSGSGKSTIGMLLAEALALPFIEADDLHPRSNVDKMASGIGLTDEDREPWLRLVRAAIDAEPEGAVIACSALKQSYRAILLGGLPDPHTVLLRGTEAQLERRLERRKGHFMPTSLLASQLAALEEPDDAIVVDIAAPPEAIVARVVAELRG